MKIYTLTASTFVHTPLAEVFTFFAKPENLALLTPQSLGFVILTPSPVEMQRGTIIDYTVRILGMRVRWKSIISTYKPPNVFVDEQLKGPYSFWHHTHTFSETDDGTLITDVVRYAMPLGLLGRLVHWLFVRKQLGQIFLYRKNTIESLFHAEAFYTAGGERKN